MKSVTINFSRDGTQAPVFITTSLSEPKWQIVEMDVSEGNDQKTDVNFYKTFENVEDGEYQYKFRIGYDFWALDPHKETVLDPSGNINNVVRVQTDPDSESSDSDATFDGGPWRSLGQKDKNDDKSDDKNEDKKEQAKQTEETEKTEEKETTSTAPIPITVVDKVPDAQPPSYGDVEMRSLEEDLSKRAQDAEPDAEYLAKPDGPKEDEFPPSIATIPRVVVEKTDDEPSHGDDFGEEATSGQKVAHKLRAADAVPDETITSPTANSSPLLSHETLDEEHEEHLVPLFSHEAFDEKTEDPDIPQTHAVVPDLLFRHETFQNDADSTFADVGSARDIGSVSDDTPVRAQERPYIQTFSLNDDAVSHSTDAGSVFSDDTSSEGTNVRLFRHETFDDDAASHFADNGSTNDDRASEASTLVENVYHIPITLRGHHEAEDPVGNSSSPRDDRITVNRHIEIPNHPQSGEGSTLRRTSEAEDGLRSISEAQENCIGEIEDPEPAREATDSPQKSEGAAQNGDGARSAGVELTPPLTPKALAPPRAAFEEISGKDHSRTTTPASKYRTEHAPTVTTAGTATDMMSDDSVDTNVLIGALRAIFVLPFVSCFRGPSAKRNAVLVALSVLIAVIAYYVLPAT